MQYLFEVVKLLINPFSIRPREAMRIQLKLDVNTNILYTTKYNNILTKYKVVTKYGIITVLHASHTYIRTDQFSKTTFLDSGDLKTYKSGENSISKILTENNTSITLR